MSTSEGLHACGHTTGVAPAIGSGVEVQEITGRVVRRFNQMPDSIDDADRQQHHDRENDEKAEAHVANIAARWEANAEPTPVPAGGSGGGIKSEPVKRKKDERRDQGRGR